MGGDDLVGRGGPMGGGDRRYGGDRGDAMSNVYPMGGGDRMCAWGTAIPWSAAAMPWVALIP